MHVLLYHFSWADTGIMLLALKLILNTTTTSSSSTQAGIAPPAPQWRGSGKNETASLKSDNGHDSKFPSFGVCGGSEGCSSDLVLWAEGCANGGALPSPMLSPELLEASMCDSIVRPQMIDAYSRSGGGGGAGGGEGDGLPPSPHSPNGAGCGNPERERERERELGM